MRRVLISDGLILLAHRRQLICIFI